jgi:pimeloyl-ACP methyl ester carboxylesterase
MRRLRRLGWDEGAVRSGLDTFDAVMDALREPFETGWPAISGLPLLSELIDAGIFIPDHAELWSFAARLVEYDPGPALARLDVALLALLGAEDAIVPVQRSAELFRSLVRADLLELRVVPGGDHRFQSAGEFVPGYLETIIGFVATQSTRPGRR